MKCINRVQVWCTAFPWHVKHTISSPGSKGQGHQTSHGPGRKLEINGELNLQI